MRIRKLRRSNQRGSNLEIKHTLVSVGHLRVNAPSQSDLCALFSYKLARPFYFTQDFESSLKTVLPFVYISRQQRLSVQEFRGKMKTHYQPVYETSDQIQKYETTVKFLNTYLNQVPMFQFGLRLFPDTVQNKNINNRITIEIKASRNNDTSCQKWHNDVSL